MAFRIIRGTLVGVTLGLLIGVALSGAMYMVNYMKEGIYGEQPQGLVAEEDRIIKEVVNIDKPVPFVQPDAVNDESKDDVLGESLIRFHVRANSNSDVDTALKYKVRDKVLLSLEDGLSECTTRIEAQNYLTDNMDYIKAVAEETLSSQGYNYAVKAYLTNDYFPMRQYGEMVIPAGYYQALRIDIGLARGENFWCLLYPTMCFPTEAGGIVTKEGQEELEETLSPEQYEKLFVKKEVPKGKIEVRFKLWNMLFGEE